MPEFFGKAFASFVGPWSPAMGRQLDEAMQSLQAAVIQLQRSPNPPSTIQAGVDADDSPSGSNVPALEDHVHDVDTAAPAHPTGTTAAEGTGAALMRADATIAQGIVTTKGDVLTYGSAPARLGVGADGLVLTADSGETTGLQWGPIVLSPAQITGNVNNYAPGRANVYRIDLDADHDITGLVAGTHGEIRFFVNLAAFLLTFKHESGSSTDVNRFLMRGGGDIVLDQNAWVALMYDGTTQRWRAKLLL